jgi:sulfonate transport system substrate-binding protein
MTRRPRAWRLATAAATALGLSVMLAACGQQQGASTSSTPSSSAAESTAPDAAADAVDTAGVTLRIGETGWKTQQLLLEKAGLADTPYKTEFSLFQGGNLQLEALGAGAIDLASASEIPPIFAAQSGGPGSRRHRGSRGQHADPGSGGPPRQ